MTLGFLFTQTWERQRKMIPLKQLLLKKLQEYQLWYLKKYFCKKLQNRISTGVAQILADAVVEIDSFQGHMVSI